MLHYSYTEDLAPTLRCPPIWGGIDHTRTSLFTALVALIVTALAPIPPAAAQADDSAANLGGLNASGAAVSIVGTGGLVISGTLLVPEGGEVVLALTTADNFDEPDASLGGILFAVDQPEDGTDAYAFRFEDVAPGRYALKGYLDTNGNRQLDVGMFGPREPWITYRDERFTFRAPRFEDVSFELLEDLTGIVLEFR